MNEEEQKLKAQAYDLVCEIEAHQTETGEILEKRKAEFDALFKRRKDLHKEIEGIHE